MKNPRFIFIDDSGDPGIEKSPGEYLVMAAVIFDTAEDATYAAEWVRNYKRSRGWSINYELKFHRLNKDIALDILKRAGYELSFRVAVVYVNKRQFLDSHTEITLDRLYIWVLAELLKDVYPQNDKVHIDGRANKEQVRQQKTYLRKELKVIGCHTKDLDFYDSAKMTLIQLVDLVVGASRRKLEPKNDKRKYLQSFSDRISWYDLG